MDDESSRLGRGAGSRLKDSLRWTAVRMTVKDLEGLKREQSGAEQSR